MQNLFNPNRVLIGSAKTPSGAAAANALANLFASWVLSSKIVCVNTWSSELSKLVANAMLAQRISSINSISAICEKTGADIEEISHSIGLDPRIGPKILKAGLGFGGSCFRKDIASLTYLAESLGLEEVADYWHSVNHINELQRRRFVQRVIRQMDDNLSGKKITLLGFAFKKGTGDTRESLAVDIINELLEERPAEIAIFDPRCRIDDIQRELDLSLQQVSKGHSSRVVVCSDAYGACSKTDAILLINDSDQFKASAGERDARVDREDAESPGLGDFELANGNRLRLEPPKPCPSGCLTCRTTVHGQESTSMVDWRRISDLVKEPKLVFDGRCVLDVETMEALGFTIESVGRQSSLDASARV